MARLIRRGEIRWYRFSTPDKKRPVLILTRDSALEFLNDVTVAPVTTTIRDIPSEVLLTEADGLTRACAINLDHMQTVSKARIGAVVATLRSSRMGEVRSALLFATGSRSGTAQYTFSPSARNTAHVFSTNSFDAGSRASSVYGMPRFFHLNRPIW